jgi:O-acetylserine/cysteine efflux transporter
LKYVLVRKGAGLLGQIWAKHACLKEDLFMKKQDIGLGLIVVTLWGMNFIAIKLGVSHVPPLFLVALRFLLVAVPAVFFLPRPQIAWKGLISLSMTLYVGQFGLLFLGIKLGMPTGLASLVQQSQAFFTLLIAVIFLKEKLRWNHLTGLLIAAAGIILIASRQNTGMTLIGFWLILAASASWGAGNVIMRRVTLGVPPFSMLSLVVWSGLVSFFPMAILSFLIEGPASWITAIQQASWTSAFSLLYLAYCASLVGYGLWGRLLARYPASTVSPFALLVPILATVSGVLFLGESFSFHQLAGSVLVMTGLVIHVFGQRIRWRLLKSRV